MRGAAISTLLAVAAAILISTATAAPKEAAAGTVSVTDRTTVMSYRDGNDIVRELLVHRTLTGTFAGTEVSLVHNATTPTGALTSPFSAHAAARSRGAPARSPSASAE